MTPTTAAPPTRAKLDMPVDLGAPFGFPVSCGFPVSFASFSAPDVTMTGTGATSDPVIMEVNAELVLVPAIATKYDALQVAVCGLTVHPTWMELVQSVLA